LQKDNGEISVTQRSIQCGIHGNMALEY